MGNVVLNLEINKIMEMRNYYGKNLLDKNIPGSVFAAKTSACMITAYKSGKVLFQGNDSEKEASKWGSATSNKPSSPTKSKSPAKGDLPVGISQMSVIGSDEVGTGDFFGPITVVATYVKKKIFHC